MADVFDSIRDVVNNPTGDLDDLSPRQHEIGNLAARGYVTREIASLLRVSEKTVSSHLEKIKLKTGIDKTGLVTHLVRRIEKVLDRFG
jgi:DNA-binding CsgD family transcriptional regulator